MRAMDGIEWKGRAERQCEGQVACAACSLVSPSDTRLTACLQRCGPKVLVSPNAKVCKYRYDRPAPVLGKICMWHGVTLP